MKAVLTVIGKLSDRTINGDLLRYLAKTANDEQAGIRTNTTICLGKIARNLGPSVGFPRLVGFCTMLIRERFRQEQKFLLQHLHDRYETRLYMPEMLGFSPWGQQWMSSARMIVLAKYYLHYALC